MNNYKYIDVDSLLGILSEHILKKENINVKVKEENVIIPNRIPIKVKVNFYYEIDDKKKYLENETVSEALIEYSKQMGYTYTDHRYIGGVTDLERFSRGDTVCFGGIKIYFKEKDLVMKRQR